MNLRTLAEADNAIILEDDVSGFGVPIIFRPPPVVAVLTAQASGTNGVTIPVGTIWSKGSVQYKTAGSVIISAGVANMILVAQTAGVVGNIETGESVSLAIPIAGVDTEATVTGTTTSGANPEYSMSGKTSRVGVDVDPETGLVIPGNKTSVTVRLSRFPLGVFPETDWMVETTDITGSVVRGKILYPMLDRTAGRVTVMVGK